MTLCSTFSSGTTRSKMRRGEARPWIRMKVGSPTPAIVVPKRIQLRGARPAHRAEEHVREPGEDRARHGAGKRFEHDDRGEHRSEEGVGQRVREQHVAKESRLQERLRDYRYEARTESGESTAPRSQARARPA